MLVYAEKWVAWTWSLSFEIEAYLRGRMFDFREVMVAEWSLHLCQVEAGTRDVQKDGIAALSKNHLSGR